MQAFRQPTILVLALVAGMAIDLGLHASQILAQEEHQYSFGDISVPTASADEPVRKELSVEKAVGR